MLVNIFGSSLVTPTNPPPDAAGDPNPPPDRHADDGRRRPAPARRAIGADEHGAHRRGRRSFDPTTCTPA